MDLNYKKYCKVCSVEFFNKNGKASLCPLKECRDKQKHINATQFGKNKREKQSANNQITCEICNKTLSALSGHLAKGCVGKRLPIQFSCCCQIMSGVSK